MSRFTLRPAADDYQTVHDGSVYLGSIRPGGDGMLLVYLPGGGLPVASRGSLDLACKLLCEHRFEFSKVHTGRYMVAYDGEPVGEVRLEERPGRSNRWHAFHLGAALPVASVSRRIEAASALATLGSS